MSRKLGICVTTTNNMLHLLGIVGASKKANVFTDIFLTGEGVHLTQNTSFAELLNSADRVGVCEVSFVDFGYNKEDIKGLIDKDFVTQMRNAELVEHCDRYLVL
jgi:hypothetical protein